MELKRLFPDPNCELPKTDDGGGPEGVNDAAEEGGGPAGVVEGLAEKEFFEVPFGVFWKVCNGLLAGPGVDGSCGLDERGTEKPDMVTKLAVPASTEKL